MRQGFQADPLGILASSRKSPLPPDLRRKAPLFSSPSIHLAPDRIKTQLTRINSHHAGGLEIAANPLPQCARPAGG
jgi:hypothetical protein